MAEISTDKSNGNVLTETAREPIVPSGHLDQMIRQTRAYHAQLSQMADVKASMMLTLASLITTFAIRYLEDPFLRWPVVIMICCCLVTIISAAYAVMPKINVRRKPNVTSASYNLLFFGTFAGMEYEEWAAEMEPLLHDPTMAYHAQIRDIYEMGIYLGRKKYRFIRIAYTAFLTGFIASAAVLILVEGAHLLSRLF